MRLQPLVEQFLSERGLALSPAKTVITHVDDGFDFLGQTVRRLNGKLLIKPAKKSICAVLTKIRGIIRGSHGVSAAVLAARINPVVPGWTNYHRHVACSRVFSSMDNEIWISLWRWARRPHTNKSAYWVKDKYFPTQGARRWRFSGAFVDASGTKRVTPVFLASSVHFQRHIPIRSDANPFDPEWDAYFQKRRRRPSVARAAFSPERV
jgi:RNA-directed DNA polymerase